MTHTRGHQHLIRTAVLLGAAVLLLPIIAGTAEADTPRAQMRAALKTAVAEHGAQHFRLLVIPVDFADARFGESVDWPAVGRTLAGDGESLETYFSIASGGVMNLETVLAPTVSLMGVRRDYSDRDLGGDAVRSRAMATQALQAVREHVPFLLVDGDGPDGLPGSGDDDGFVDGVLILHAAPGLENDLDDGLIVPLQYWLPVPVEHDGVASRSYAVASIHSGLGMWLHETAHLLGLEDRYDLFLSPADNSQADVGWGGLGMFSLMGAGHRGTGDGSGAALLDAYSAAVLGWVVPRTLHGSSDGPVGAPFNPTDASAWSIDVPGTDGREYFLLETRGNAGPFDAAVPDDRLLIYHVDESVPDDSQSSTNPDQRHLRVRLVEADGLADVTAARNLGAVDDLFPSSSGADAWSPDSDPSTDGYASPTGASLRSFTPLGSGLLCSWEVPAFAVSVTADIVPAPIAVAGYRVELSATYLGEAPTSMSVSLTDPAGGSFEGAVVWATDLALEQDDSTWTPVAPIPWEDEDASAWAFDLTLLAEGSVVHEQRFSFTIDAPEAPLDFSDDESWGLWSSGSDGTTSTVWKRWIADGGIAPDGTHVLAVTRGDVLPSDWPDAVYDNGAEAWLLSPPFQPGPHVVLTHMIDVAEVVDRRGADGAVVEAVLSDGTVVPLVPRGNYPGRIPSWSSSALGGRDAFVDVAEFEGMSEPVWDVDVFDTAGLGDADIRLRFRFASDALWRARGWFLRRVELRNVEVGFGLDREGALWRLSWPETGGFVPSLQARQGSGSPWARFDLDLSSGTLDHDELVDAFGGGLWQLRLRSDATGHRRRSRSVLLFPEAPIRDEVPILVAWPNPVPKDGSLQLRLGPDVGTGSLDLYDLRGRRLRHWNVGPGERILDWDGRDGDGRRLPAGRYCLRLRSSHHTATRSLTFLP